MKNEAKVTSDATHTYSYNKYEKMMIIISTILNMIYMKREESLHACIIIVNLYPTKEKIIQVRAKEKNFNKKRNKSEIWWNDEKCCE